MGLTWKDIENEFKNMGPISKAGFGHDVAKHVFEGGMFWYIGEVIRHVGGKNNVYNDYYYRIRHHRENMYFKQAAEVALEGAEYARQQGDMLQCWGFLYEAGYVDYAVFRVIIYCRVARRASSPGWYWRNSLTSCDYYWSRYKRADSEDERSYCLGLLGKVALDAYKYVVLTYGECNGVQEGKKLDKACLYVALSQLAEMGNGFVRDSEDCAMQKKVLADVKGVCKDYKSLLAALKREGVSTALLEQVSPTRDIFNEFMSLKMQSGTEESVNKKSSTGKSSDKSTEELEEMRRKREEARRLERQRLAEEAERRRRMRELERKAVNARLLSFILRVGFVAAAVLLVRIPINANRKDWKTAYDDYMISAQDNAWAQYYTLHDMNFDGIPELLYYYYKDAEASYFQISTYRKGEVRGLYGDSNVVPYKIGATVKTYHQSSSEETRVYKYTMITDEEDSWGKDVRKRPKPEKLLVYEEGDILTGRYKDKEADLSYLELPVENDYWEFDMEVLYDLIEKEYTVDEWGRRLKVKNEYLLGSSFGRTYVTFDAEIEGAIGELTCEWRWPLSISWLTKEDFDVESFVEHFYLERIGSDREGYDCYSWYDELEIKVKSPGKSGQTKIEICLMK